MMYRSKAPLRLGLAGGGTDVSPYTDQFGGCVLNAAISLYAHASLHITRGSQIILRNISEGSEQTFAVTETLPINGKLDLLKGVYNRMQRDHGFPVCGFELTTSVDTPIGSGLGTSSTLVVAMLGAFAAAVGLQLSKQEIARLAYDTERLDLGFAGGRQDQYAASFGGINFMRFDMDEQVTVERLALAPNIVQELENNLVLYYTGHSRQSGAIIREQQHNVLENNTTSINAMHGLKAQANLMQDALLNGRLDEVGKLFDFGFDHKRRMAGGISNPAIEAIYDAAKKAGATGGKISGAGGGGFMFFYCPQNSRFSVIDALQKLGGEVYHFTFTREGMTSWTV